MNFNWFDGIEHGLLQCVIKSTIFSSFYISVDLRGLRMQMNERSWNKWNIHISIINVHVCVTSIFVLVKLYRSGGRRSSHTRRQSGSCTTWVMTPTSAPGPTIRSTLRRVQLGTVESRVHFASRVLLVTIMVLFWSSCIIDLTLVWFENSVQLMRIWFLLLNSFNKSKDFVFPMLFLLSENLIIYLDCFSIILTLNHIYN